MIDRHRPAVPILRFFGATETVTGSRFLLDTPRARVLVDCGLFQGLKALRRRNWDPFPVDPASIDAVVLTHAHVDHSGYLPALRRDGFRGAVFCTDGTEALSRILLPDSGRLQEEDAAYANRRGFSKHEPALPLFTEEDAHRALERFKAIPFGAPIEVAPGTRALFAPAGHILGSASVLLSLDGPAPRRVVFSGDLGRRNHPIFNPPAPIPEADLVVTESTYGDRRHEDETEALLRFSEAIDRTAKRGGTVVIPSFAVDRTEVVLFHLRRMIGQNAVPRLPIYVDSPMACAALRVYRDALSSGSPELRSRRPGDGDPFDPGRLTEVQSVEESKAINAQRFPSIIISASGMATGGRVLHHLAQRLPDHRCAVILVGFQAEGTRGRLLAEGARVVKLLGRYVPVRAEIVNIPALSVHADRAEILDWLRGAPRAPDAALVVHGEAGAAESLRQGIVEELGWTAAVPKYLEQVRLD